MDRVVLLDADIPVYKYAAAAQVDTNGERLYRPLPVVKKELDEQVEVLADQMEATKVVICLSSDPNWRKTVLPTYKGNRKGEDPEYRAALKQHLIDNYECEQRPTLEGDDVMGILATDPDYPGKKVIVSIDKDMQTIPTRIYPKRSVNWLFNPDKDRKPRKVSENEADYFWMLQTLMGDSTDGYTGIPNVGPAKAQKILGPMKEGTLELWWELVCDAYDNKGLSMDDACVQADVARILRFEDYWNGLVSRWSERPERWQV